MSGHHHASATLFEETVSSAQSVGKHVNTRAVHVSTTACLQTSPIPKECGHSGNREIPHVDCNRLHKSSALFPLRGTTNFYSSAREFALCVYLLAVNMNLFSTEESVEAHPRTSHEGPQGSRGIATLFL